MIKCLKYLEKVIFVDLQATRVISKMISKYFNTSLLRLMRYQIMNTVGGCVTYIFNYVKFSKHRARSLSFQFLSQNGGNFS